MMSQTKPEVILQMLATSTAVAFDFDGTLVDSLDIKEKAFAQIFASFGPEVRESAANHHSRNPGRTRFEKIKHVVDEHGLTGVGARVDLLAADFARLVEDEVSHAPLFPGALELLNVLTKSHKVFVVSATPHDELRRILGKQLAGVPIEGFFGFPPEKTESLSVIIETYRLLPTQLLVIGDSPSDLEAANAVGSRFIGICNGSQVTFDGQVSFVSLAEFLSVLQ